MDAETITASALLLALEYNPSTGKFTRRVSIRGRYGRAGRECGSPDKDGYIHITLNQRKYAAHRLAWLAVHGVMPSGQIDHKNGISDDNRISNLRDVSASVNMQNRRAISTNKSGLLGVSKNTKGETYRADIVLNGRRYYLGCFPNAEAAHAAYLVAKRTMHEGSTL